ncbi:hypothetical protein ACF06X_33575 [Streptomyces sp. NPDC015346]|uniref:hypothetical protein n=1 Tax=Streptomyces sp. NPDC015346 TaxID=3364954 RepID=UPI0036FB4819
MTDHDYIAQLVAELDLVAVFRIPCQVTSYDRTTDITVEKRVDGHGGGWAIIRDGETWTGTRWEHRVALCLSEVYRWDRDTALTEAQRIAELHALVAERRHG